MGNSLFLIIANVYCLWILKKKFLEKKSANWNILVVEGNKSIEKSDSSGERICYIWNWSSLF